MARDAMRRKAKVTGNENSPNQCLRFGAMRKKPVNSTFNHRQSGHSLKVFISRKNRKSRFDGQCCDPNIVDRNHRATLLEIKVNPGIDRRSDSRNMKHCSVANKISNTRPSRVPFVGLQDPETKFGESNKRDGEVLAADSRPYARVTTKQTDDCACVSDEIDSSAIHGICSKASMMCLSNSFQSSGVISSLTDSG